jgi:hypothetical protein
MAWRRRSTWLLLLATACAATSATGKGERSGVVDAIAPWFTGTFAGSDADGQGSGTLDLGADRTFHLRFTWSTPGLADVYGEWHATGVWVEADPPTKDVADLDVAWLQLQVTSAEGALRPGAVLHAFVNRETALVSAGPCISFALPRRP